MASTLRSAARRNSDDDHVLEQIQVGEIANGTRTTQQREGGEKVEADRRKGLRKQGAEV
jgi:hypothetical protein